MLSEGTPPASTDEVREKRLRKALEHLHELYTWQDIERADYLRQRDDILEQIASTRAEPAPVNLPNMQRAAELLGDVGSLWLHPGVSGERRAEFVEEIFEELLFDEHGLRRVTPRSDYSVLMAISERSAGGGNGRGDWI